MAYQKIQYPSSQTTAPVFEVKREDPSGFIPFSVSNTGFYSNGTATLNNLNVSGTTNLNGPTNVQGAINFNGTTTFSNPPVGVVSTATGVYTSDGLSGGGPLSTSRFLILSNLGVSTAKIQDGAVTYDKLNSKDVVRLNSGSGAVPSGDGIQMAVRTVINLNLGGLTTPSIVSVPVSTIVGIPTETDAAFKVLNVDIKIKDDAGQFEYPIDFGRISPISPFTVYDYPCGTWRLSGDTTNAVEMIFYPNSFFTAGGFTFATATLTLTFLTS